MVICVLVVGELVVGVWVGVAAWFVAARSVVGVVMVGAFVGAFIC